MNWFKKDSIGCRRPCRDHLCSYSKVCYRGPVLSVRKSDISLFHLFWLRWAACGILETWPEIETVPSALGWQSLKALDGQGSPNLQHLILSWAPCTFITLDAFWWGAENQMITQGWLFKKETLGLQRWRKERKGGDEESRVQLAEDKCTRVWKPITVYRHYRNLNQHCGTIDCDPNHVWATTDMRYRETQKHTKLPVLDKEGKGYRDHISFIHSLHTGSSKEGKSAL